MYIRDLHHVQITIPPSEKSEAEARTFYMRTLGLQEIEKPDALKPRGGFWLRLGDRELHIGVEDGLDRITTKAHVALEVDDLAAWRRRLADAGIRIKECVPIPGFDRFECRDPFGNRLELISPTEGTSRDLRG